MPSAQQRALRPAISQDRELHLDVYGLRISVQGDWPEVLDALRRDFAWFSEDAAASGAHVTVTVHRAIPDPERYGELRQAFITTRNAVFQDGHTTVIDYFGRALVVYDRRREELRIEGEDEQLVHEAAYLFLLSRTGRHLDHSGLTRVHALGLSGAQGAVLLLLPSGGGKTTLALRSLRDPGVRLLSEDTPLLDRHGFAHPFPLRIGVNPGDRDLLPDGEVAWVERLEFQPKLLLSVDAFADRVEREPRAIAHIVVGRRTLAASPTLTGLPRRAVVGPLLRDAVIGVGVAQMVEYVLQTGARDILRQGGVAARRARSCTAALASARAWDLRLTRDTEKNWSALAGLLR